MSRFRKATSAEYDRDQIDYLGVLLSTRQPTIEDRRELIDRVIRSVKFHPDTPGDEISYTMQAIMRLCRTFNCEKAPLSAIITRALFFGRQQYLDQLGKNHPVSLDSIPAERRDQLLNYEITTLSLESFMSFLEGVMVADVPEDRWHEVLEIVCEELERGNG